MSSDIPKDWEKEYHESFTKKIPFPSFRYDSIRLNPAIEGLMYSFTTVSIHNALKFELYVQYGTCAELNNIVRELKEKKLAEEAAKPKEEEKKEEEKKEEEKKEGAELPPANLPKAPSGDLTEKALNILTERRRNQRKEQIEELKKKEEEERKKKEEEAKKRKEIDGKAKKEGDKEEDKKMNEEKKEDDDKGEEEEKKENVDEVYEDSETMYLFETESTYLEDMKNCKKIITLWELTATGTRKINEVYIFESVSYSMEFSTDGKIFVMMGSDYKTCYIYNALNLELISKCELKGQDGNGYDLTYFYTMYPSYDGSYLLSGDTYSRCVFDNQGKFIKCFNANNVYTMYMYSKNEYLGIKPNESYTKTNLVAFDFINGIEKQFYEFDSYVGSVNLSPEFNAFTYDQYPKYMYCNMKGNKEKFEVFKEYTTVNKVVFKGDKLGIVNSINYTITNISLYHGDKVLWKHTLKRSWVDIRDLKFADKESDNLIMIEYYNSEFIIYLFNKDGYSDFNFKAMRDVIFQYPYIIYGRGSKEIWVQNMENKVEIYYFDNNIQAIENTSRFRDLTYGGMSLGMVMDYHDYFSISRLEISFYGKSYKYFKRKFNKNELLNQSVKSYNRIRVQNAQRKKIEEAVLFHLNNSLILLSLESRDFKHEIQRSFKERNIVCLSDNSAIYLWDDNGDKIEMLKSGFDPSSSNYLIKVFEADEDIRLVKSTIIDGIEYLLVVDEQKHCKLLKNEEARSIVYKDYYIDTYFSTSPDVLNVQSYSYSNGMLYSNSGGIMLQEKGNEKEYKFYNLSFSTMSFDYNRPYFPICSENYILYSLNGEYNADYTSMYSYLLLAPPMNKQRINQRSKMFFYGYSCEFFLHFDDKYVIELKNNYGQIEFKVYSLNGEVVQTLNISFGDNSGDPIFSQSGEYFAIICSIPPEEQDVKFFPKKADPNAYSYFSETDPIRAPTVKLFRLRKTEEYKKQQAIKDASVLDQFNNAQKLKEILKVDFVKKFDIPHECLKQGFYGSDDSFVYECSESNAKQKLHVDNKGNVILISPSRSLLLVNGKNEWSTFNEYITKYKFENYDALEIFKYGQGIICFKKEEKIFTICYDVISSKLFDGFLIGHDAIDTKRCKLIYIIPTKVEHFILLVYQFENNTTTIICWNIDEDHEHSNFSSQPGDLFIDYFTDRNSKLGFASFNNYIVDMDNCIPNPFIKRTERDEERFWLQGMKANFNQDMFLNKGYLVSSICFKDIYYNKYKSLDLLDIEKVTYYMDKKSVIFDYLEEHDKLLTVLNIFEKNPIYYSMILLPNNDNKTALEFAIENNSAKVVEVLLNSLIKLGDVSLSKMIYKQFPHLFKMQLVAFASYLNTCYFTTSQMATINKLRIPEGVDSIREFTDCCILDKQFYEHFGIDEKGLKTKNNAIYPADRPISVQDIKVDENKDKFEINKNPLKRVTIKGIEFDWIFKSKEGSDFLQELSETENIRIFEHEIIKDIVLFQWSYFKIHIILKLLIPYIIYFLIFVLHVTYIIKNEHYETSKEAQPYHISAWIFGSIILIFNVFWAYVEFTQMMFHKSVYFKSFWNLLDLSSVALNTAVVIMEFSSADFANINRVSSVSVLILYFKIFYFLRIFFATGYLVRMIVQIVVDMKNFVVVLIISVMAFADSYYILGRNSDSTNFAGQDIAGAFIFSWSMGIGNADTSGFKTKDEEVLYIIYIINLIINLVMLLNLVVAIMGDTFDKVQKTQELSMLQELAQMIRENEFLFSRKRIFKKAKYILVIEPEKAEGVGLTSWEGKINQIKTFIEESTTEHMKQLKKLQSNIEDIASEAMNEKLQPIEDRINQKLSNCDQRVQKIKDSTEALMGYFDVYVKNIETKNKK